nr:EAL domain-containing protein [uncultured Catonella sp.]
MEKKINSKFLLYPLFIASALYLASVLLGNPKIAQIGSVAIGGFSVLTIIFLLKFIGNNKIYYKFYIIAIAIDTLADILQFFIPDNMVYIIDIIYLFSNFVYAMWLVIFVFKELKNWNKYQFFSDIFIISIICFSIIWSLFTGINHVRIGINVFAVSIYIFLDFCILNTCALVFLSKGIKKLPKNLYFPYLAILIYSLSDYYFTYRAITSGTISRDMLDVFYKLSAILFTLGAIYEAGNPSPPFGLEETELAENLKTPKKTFAFLGITTMILFFEGFISIPNLIIILFSCVLYWGSTATIRFQEVNKLLLKAEQNNSRKLEELVQKRTNDLMISYRKLEEISNIDVLTGLYSYKYFTDYLNEITIKRIPFVFIYMDINRFKFINDSYGHIIGDKVLQAVASRLKVICPDYGKLFRIGGDEFIIILTKFLPIKDIEEFAENILKLFETELHIEPYTLKINTSIGISLFPNDSLIQEELIKYADIAMYTVKDSPNKNHYSFFNKSMLDSFNKKQEIEMLYKNADPEKEFVLYFQPQYSIKGKKLIGMEALIRWIHPVKGMISPIYFIPIIEDTGEIIALGKLVIRKAFAQIKEWNEKFNLNLRISINVSPKQIEDTNFINWLKFQMKESDVKTDWVDLELTESSYMHFNDENKHIFNELFNMGINTSIDDFGTGYSSLSYIKSLNFNRLKIAKELIDNIENDENSQLIIKAIIMMADGLKLKTIAEGVEDECQLNLLTKLGCDEVQGYIWGKPVPPDEFEKKYIVNIN